MIGNAEVKKRFELSTRSADTVLGILAQLKTESDGHWGVLSDKVSEIGRIVLSTNYAQTLPEDWRETVMAFTKIQVQRNFAFLAELVFRTDLFSLKNFRDWRAQVSLMHKAVVNERSFTETCEVWVEKQKQWKWQQQQQHQQQQ